MESEILADIIDQTRQKLQTTDTELNILDLLQTYDNYIKNNKVSIDLKTKVYKRLLKWSRENLQSDTQSDNNSSTNNVLNSDLDFEFRDASTFDKDKPKLDSVEKPCYGESERHQDSSAKKMTLPKLTFDSFIEDNSDNSANEKEFKNHKKPPMSKLAISKVNNSDERISRNAQQERMSTAGNSVGRLTPSFRNRKARMIIDENPYDLTKADRQSNLSTNSDKFSSAKRNKSSEAKNHHRFSDLMRSYDSEETKQPTVFENSDVSEGYVASNYCRRKLLSKVWKSLLIEKMKSMQTKMLTRMGENHYEQQLMQKTFKGFIMYTQSCLIDKLEKAKGEEIYKLKVFRKVFNALKKFTSQESETARVKEIKAKLDYKKKLVLMRKWKESILSSQVRRAQMYTAVFIHKKKLQTKAYETLKIYSSALKMQKHRMSQAVRFEQVKLLTTGFKVLHWYKNKRHALRQLDCKIGDVYFKLAKKRGFKTFRKK